MQEQFEEQFKDQQLYHENKIHKVQANVDSTVTLATSVLADTTAVPTEFISSLLGIGDDGVPKLEDWTRKTRKIWLAKL